MKNIGVIKVTDRGRVLTHPGTGLNAWGQPNAKGVRTAPVPKKPASGNRRKF